MKRGFLRVAIVPMSGNVMLLSSNTTLSAPLPARKLALLSQRRGFGDSFWQLSPSKALIAFSRS